VSYFFFLLLPLLPSSTLFPYTTLFRSLLTRAALACALGSGPLLHASTHAPMHHLLAHARTRLRRRRLRCGGRGWRLLLCRGRLRSEEHTSELQSRFDLVCRLLLEKKKD